MALLDHGINKHLANKSQMIFQNSYIILHSHRRGLCSYLFLLLFFIKEKFLILTLPFLLQLVCFVLLKTFFLIPRSGRWSLCFILHFLSFAFHILFHTSRINFVCRVGWGSNLTFFVWIINGTQYHLLNCSFFSHWFVMPPISCIKVPYYM